MPVKNIFIFVVVLAMVSAAAAGMFLAGSPEKERMRRFDQERLNDLSSISYAIDTYWNRSRQLPATLEDLKTQPDIYLRSLRDQKTGEPYEYASSASTTYELCANFETDTKEELARMQAMQAEVPGQDFWQHPIGRKCYTLEVRINPDILKQGKIIPPAPIHITD